MVRACPDRAGGFAGKAKAKEGDRGRLGEGSLHARQTAKAAYDAINQKSVFMTCGDAPAASLEDGASRYRRGPLPSPGEGVDGHVV